MEPKRPKCGDIQSKTFRMNFTHHEGVFYLRRQRKLDFEGHFKALSLEEINC